MTEFVIPLNMTPKTANSKLDLIKFPKNQKDIIN